MLPSIATPGFDPVGLDRLCIGRCLVIYWTGPMSEICHGLASGTAGRCATDIW